MNAAEIALQLFLDRKKERNPLQKGVDEDIIGPCGV